MYILGNSLLPTTLKIFVTATKKLHRLQCFKEREGAGVRFIVAPADVPNAFCGILKGLNSKSQACVKVIYDLFP